MKKISFIFIIITNIFAMYSDLDIANAIKKNSLIYNIDNRFIYTLAKIESNFNPLAISFTSYKKEPLKFDDIRVVRNRYKNKYIFTLYPNSIKKAVKAVRYIIKNGYHLDIGLMQINSVNFNDNEIEKVFNLDYNIQKAVEVLNFCQKEKKYLKETIECYNKGLQKNVNFDYYQKFKNSFIKDFAL